MKWHSEWKCPKCARIVWANGRPPKKNTGLIQKMLLCRSCPSVMQPTGNIRRIYTTVELLGDVAWKNEGGK